MSAFQGESILPPYPEGTPGYENRNGAYWPNLSPNVRTQLTLVEDWVIQENIDMNELCSYTIDHRLTMLRYLRANGLDSRKAIAHMQRNLLFRREKNVAELSTFRPEGILGCKMADLTTTYPHWHQGYDKTGRPVLYKMYGKFDASKVKKLCGGNYDNVMLYHLWEQEATANLCYQQSLKLNKIVETSTGIIDVKNMSMFQITRDFLNLVQQMAEIDQQQYPETLGRLYIINTPSAFPMVWKMVKPWIDPVTASKIHILSSPREYEPALAEFIGVENLPSNYGGVLPELNPTIHPYAQTIADMENVEIASACAY